MYFFVGAILSYLYYLVLLIQNGAVSYIIPHIIATAVFVFYTFTSYWYLMNFNAVEKKNLFSITLLMQSLQVEWNGFVFKNFYFPTLNYTIDLKNLSNNKFNYSFFTFKIGNGYFSDNIGVLISINILLVIILFIANYKTEITINKV